MPLAGDMWWAGAAMEERREREGGGLGTKAGRERLFDTSLVVLLVSRELGCRGR